MDKEARRGSMHHFVTHKGVHTHTPTPALISDMSPSRASRNRDEMGIEGWKRGLKGMKGRKKEGQRQAMWLFALISVHLLTFSLAIVR